MRALTLPHSGTLLMGSNHDRGCTAAAAAAGTRRNLLNVPYLSLQLAGPDLFELAEGRTFSRDAQGCGTLARMGVCMVKVRACSRMAHTCVHVHMQKGVAACDAAEPAGARRCNFCTTCDAVCAPVH